MVCHTLTDDPLSESADFAPATHVLYSPWPTNGRFHTGRCANQFQTFRFLVGPLEAWKTIGKCGRSSPHIYFSQRS